MRATKERPESAPSEEDAILLEPILHTGGRFYFTVAVLMSVIGLGVFAYVTQYREGRC